MVSYGKPKDIVLSNILDDVYELPLNVQLSENRIIINYV